jgi:general secretion pathway protein A
MYLGFYSLQKQPFHMTPDPEFLYLSPSHKEALAAIIYGIEERKGFVTITGAVGVGKTTILRSYLESAETKRLKIIYIFNAKLTFEGLLKTIYQELNLPIESSDTVEMLNRLYEVLIEEYKQNNTVVLVVDEAQNMPVDTLESLRMISNLETSRDKLIQIVLVGQPEFEEELNLDRLRQLKQRLAIRSTILPLTKDESLEYIKFRLQKAGSPSTLVFTAPALKKIIKKANGIPRVLNVLCDNALITGFGYRKKPVTKKIVGEIVGDFEGSRRPSLHRWLLPTIVALVVAVTGALWVMSHLQPFLGKAEDFLFHDRKEQQSLVRETNPMSHPTPENDRSQPVGEAKQSTPPSPKDASAGITKKVAFGDTLSRLALEVYGSFDSEVIKQIREHNPQIADPNVIHPGNTIVFPRLPDRRRSTNPWTPRG